MEFKIFIDVFGWVNYLIIRVFWIEKTDKIKTDKI